MGKVTFREDAYKVALRRAIGGVMDKVSMSVYKAMVNNLAQLKVRKVDREHVNTFPHALKRVNRNTATKFVKHFGVNNDGQNQSFRALYYEFGTGVNMRPPAGWNPNDAYNNWNPVRPVSRGAKIYYRDEPWTDLGGNFHRKPGVRKGVKKLIPRKNIYGHSVQAHHWFRKGLKDGTRNLDSLILQAVKSVPITAYIKIRDVRVRM